MTFRMNGMMNMMDMCCMGMCMCTFTDKLISMT